MAIMILANPLRSPRRRLVDSGNLAWPRHKTIKFISEALKVQVLDSRPLP